MSLTIKQFPQRDAGTGEYSQADGPQTYEADDVTNEPEKGAVDLPESVTTVADDLGGEPTGEAVESGPTTYTADWPTVENKTVKDAEPAAPTKPAKRAAKRS
jgi:hypothetical protein